MPDGRQAVVHVEAIFVFVSFAKCSLLMVQYGVVVCVVEQLPNVNDARRFANRHPGKVFLAGYSVLKDDQMIWGDTLSRSDIKTAEDDRSRFSVSLNQYKCMQTALFRVRDAFCLFPPPEELEQDVIEDGVRKRIVLLRDWVFYHFTKTALIVEDDSETRKLVAKVKKVGLDPHYSYANMLCDVAWARQHGTSSFILPPESSGRRVNVVDALPEMLQNVINGITEHVASEVCGRCASFDKEPSFCLERGFVVSAKDPGCHFFVPAES